jgi:hypothetical protein
VKTQGYKEAQLAARAAAGDLSEEAVRRIQRTLRDHAAQLSARIAALGPEADGYALEASRRIIMAQHEALGHALGAIVGKHRTLSFETVIDIWRQAALQLGTLHNVPRALMGAVINPPLTLLGAYENLGRASATWRTLLPAYVRRAKEDVDAIVSRALLTGTGPDAIATSLRRYVMGQREFEQAFGHLPGFDPTARTGPGKFSEEARKLRHNASRIAFSEVYNARAEAETQSYMHDPFVECVWWRLAPDRGTQKEPDECDVLAMNDFFGLGPGRYPVRRVPLPPHPWDRCERKPVMRKPQDMGKPKPNPAMQLQAAHARVPDTEGLSTERADAIRQRVAEGFRRQAMILA